MALNHGQSRPCESCMHLSSTILGTRIDPGTRQPHRGRQGIGARHRARQRRVRVGVGAMLPGLGMGLGMVIGLD